MDVKSMAQSESSKITFDNGNAQSYVGVPVYSIPRALSIWLLRHPDEPQADDQHAKNPQTENKRRKRKRKDTKAESRNDREKATPMQLAIFVEDESNEGVMADPDASPPASKKRRESPRKLRNRRIQPVVDKQTKQQMPTKQPVSSIPERKGKTYQLRSKTVSSSQTVNAASIIDSLLEEGILTDNAQSNSTTEFPCVNGASVRQSTGESTQSDIDNQLSEIKISLKWMCPKQQQIRKNFTLPVNIRSSQPQEQNTSLVPQEKIFVVKLGEFPSIEELLVTENSTANVDKPVAEKEPSVTVTKPSGVEETTAEDSTVDDEMTAWEEQEELSVDQPLVENSSVAFMKEPEITDDKPTGDPHSSQERDFDWTLYDDDEYVQLSNDVCLDDDEITMNVSKSSANRSSSSSVRTPWDIADKRMLVAEAKKHGIRPTARKHNMSFSTLRVWMMQDFGDLPGTKKRLSGGGRRLRYDQSVDIALKDWVLQRITIKERVTHDNLKKKAMEMILPHNPNFQASRGWVSRFLCRHNINLRYMIHGKDAHSTSAKQFNSPSKSQSTPTSTSDSAAGLVPQSTEKVKERLQISLYHQPKENS